MIRHALWPAMLFADGGALLCFARCIAPRDGRTGRAPLVRSLSVSLVQVASGRCLCRPAFAACVFV